MSEYCVVRWVGADGSPYTRSCVTDKEAVAYVIALAAEGGSVRNLRVDRLRLRNGKTVRDEILFPRLRRVLDDLWETALSFPVDS